MTEIEQAPPKDWPPGVVPVSYENIGRMGVGHDGLLYWNGRPVVTHRTIALGRRQRAAAILVALAALAAAVGSCASGIDAAHSFGCKLHWWTMGCQ
jgi:hypothetical protein